MKRYICGFFISILISSFLPAYLIFADDEVIQATENQVSAQTPEPQPESMQSEPVTSEPIVTPIITSPETAENEPIVTPIVTTNTTTITPAIPPIIINEMMAGSEVNPQKDVWIELFNTTSADIQLAGWQLKGITDGGRWVDITTDQSAVIPANGFFLLSYYSNSSSSGLSVKPQATKSSLSFPNTEIQIELKDSSGNSVDKAYITKTGSGEFRSFERNCSYSDGMLPENWSPASAQVNLKSNLTKTFATPKSANSKCLPAGQQTQPSNTENQITDQQSENTETANQARMISEPSYTSYRLINEFLVNPAGNDETGEWIELYNSGSAPIDVSGWYLDDSDGGSSPFKIPEGSVVMPGNYIVFGSEQIRLSLKNSSDSVRLLSPDKTEKEVIIYSGASEGLSYAKNSDGAFGWTPILTPGQQNSFPVPPKKYSSDSVKFISIIPNPKGQDAGNEKITLKNMLSESVDFAGWKIIDQKQKEYEINGIVLAPLEEYEINTSSFDLTLSNKSGELSLADGLGNLIDRINWTDAKDDEVVLRPDFFTDGMKAKVLNIVDGDTIAVIINGDEYKIRLIGVDTPETVHPKKHLEKFGKEASDHLKQILEGQTVSLQFDQTKKDIYGRLLAYVFLGDLFVNAEIVKNGFGYAYTVFPFMYSEDFVKYENEAREKRLGIWSDEEAAKLIEEIKQNTETAENEVQDPVETEKTATEAGPICPNEGLQIESVLPNAEKGISVEFIKIINVSAVPVCLNGWRLDDSAESGSKPFSIGGGEISPGASRTFRKTETNISLNNSNDCAGLINPEEKRVDQICYTKTHTNELFTHEGGDWKPKTGKSKSGASDPQQKTSAKQKTESREKIAFEQVLKNETVDGNVAYIYEEGKVMFVNTGKKTIPVSYAESKVNIDSAKQLLDFKSPVKIAIRSSGADNQLISISQSPQIAENSVTDSPKQTSGIKYIFLLSAILIGLLIYRKMKK